MKNITNIEKTAIAKITAKITTTALLFFLALFTFTTCLIAQETQEGQAGQQAKKGGWFVGVTPYLLGLSEQKSSSTIVSNPTDSTVDNGVKFSFTAEAPTDEIISGTANNGAQADAQDVAERVCETGFANADGSNTDYLVNQFSPNNRNYDRNDFAFGFSTHCRDYFAELLTEETEPVDFVAPSASPKAATAKWSGAGLQFGYEFPEGNRFSLQLHNWKGGDSEVTSQMVVYDYFLGKSFYAGLGLGSIQLKALGETQSQTGSAVNLGWQYSFSPSFKLELGYLLLSAEASITKETKETRNAVISRAEVEAQTVYLGINRTNNPGYSTVCTLGSGDTCTLNNGIMVTSAPLSRETSQAYEVTETQEVTVSNPSVIYIRLTVGF